MHMIHCLLKQVGNRTSSLWDYDINLVTLHMAHCPCQPYHLFHQNWFIILVWSCVSEMCADKFSFNSSEPFSKRSIILLYFLDYYLEGK